jgi:hypothetical protein
MNALGSIVPAVSLVQLKTNQLINNISAKYHFASPFKDVS